MVTKQEPNARLFVLLGFVGAGKSTYLAAAYHIANTTKVSGSLQITASQRDLEYIETLHERWLSCRPLTRTSGQSPQVVTLDMKGPGGTAGTVRVPDVSGEALINSLSDRRWDPDFDASIQAANGLLVFVNPANVKEPVTWVEAQAWARALGDGGEEGDGQDSPKKPWSLAEASTAALLIDLLEVVLSRNLRRPIPIVLIVSAWDLIADVDPQAWVDGHLPLLSHYLRNNPSLFRLALFGVSAQGGALPEKEAELQAMDDPADRVRVVGGSGDPRDLTRPLQWLLTQ